MRYIYPPRPKGKIAYGQLTTYEKTGRWVCQRKFNGNRTIVQIANGTVELYNRHGVKADRMQRYAPEMYRQLVADILSLNLDPSKEYCLDGELLHEKTKNQNYKGKIVLYDVLLADKYLFGINQMVRLELLKAICRNPTEREPGGIALAITPSLWMAETFEPTPGNFDARYQDFLDRDEIEGLVLRDKRSSLDNFGNKEYEISWVIRCRKPHKNYGF